MNKSKNKYGHRLKIFKTTGLLKVHVGREKTCTFEVNDLVKFCSPRAAIFGACAYSVAAFIPPLGVSDSQFFISFFQYSIPYEVLGKTFLQSIKQRKNK